jgi:hypothetical protein
VGTVVRSCWCYSRLWCRLIRLILHTMQALLKLTTAISSHYFVSFAFHHLINYRYCYESTTIRMLVGVARQKLLRLHWFHFIYSNLSIKGKAIIQHHVTRRSLSYPSSSDINTNELSPAIVHSTAIGALVTSSVKFTRFDSFERGVPLYVNKCRQ